MYDAIKEFTPEIEIINATMYALAAHNKICEVRFHNLNSSYYIDPGFYPGLYNEVTGTYEACFVSPRFKELVEFMTEHQLVWYDMVSIIMYNDEYKPTFRLK